MARVGKPTEHAARKAGARHAHTVAGRPLKLGKQERRAYHAVRPRPPLHERLATRVKRKTKRIEPPRGLNLAAFVGLPAAVGQLRQAVLPDDPRDRERRERSGERVVAFVGAVDLVMLLAVAVLLVIGPVMVYSASMAFAAIHQLAPSYFFFHQTEWLLVGAVGMYIAMRTDYHRWRLLAGPGLVVSVVLLLLLHTRLSTDSGGATRWLRLGPLEAQPSEVAKVALVLYGAHWFASQKESLRNSPRGLLPFALVVGGITALVVKQPDLGTGSVILFSLLTIYFVGGARLGHLAILAVVVVVAAKFYIGHMHGYQLLRWQAFVDPYKDPQGAGFQNVQMIDALGSGGLTGEGLGQGHSKFGMPEAYNDSIFAVLGEEWGVCGTVGLLFVFMLLAYRGLRASVLAPDTFGRLLAAGLTSSIAFQAMVNIAGVADLVPFTGVPLPFVSYGGSALSITMVAAGILLNISKHTVTQREERDPAPTYLWWRNRRTSLSVAGRRRPAGVPHPTLAFSIHGVSSRDRRRTSGHGRRPRSHVKSAGR